MRPVVLYSSPSSLSLLLHIHYNRLDAGRSPVQTTFSSLSSAMLQLPESPVPCISISFAPHESATVEPKSPFAVTLPDVPDESPISQHLLPPPTLSPHQLSHVERRGQLSPLSSSHSGKGMERAKFEAMLKASKERSNVVGAKKPMELRKELAFKVQMAKQRQSLFFFHFLFSTRLQFNVVLASSPSWPNRHRPRPPTFP